jgi:acetoin utilization protein AcuB
MLVRDRMSRTVITSDEDTPIIKALNIMKDNNIRRLPVTKNEKITGMVTDRDLKEATPSKVTSLDVHEIYRLLSEIKIKDIMSKDILTIGPDESIEKAAMLMLKRKISGLPVIESGKLVGIITQTDIFKALVDISGLNRGGIKIAIEIPDVPGTTQEVINTIRAHGGRILSVMTSYDVDKEGHRHLFVRTDLDEKKLQELLEIIGKRFAILYAIKDVI